MDRISVTGICIGMALLLASCTTLEPRRTALPHGEIHCPPDKHQAPDRLAKCENQIVEKPASANYTLYMIEVDDQGRLYDGKKYPNAHQQMSEFLAEVREGAAEGKREAGDNDDSGLSVVMFVHGWKHSSRADDPNLVAFRKLLEGLAAVEERICRRRVVGVYLGWRGAAWRGVERPPVNFLETLTSFWSRKRSADRIANGAVHEVIGSLRALQHKTRMEQATSAPAMRTEALPSDPACDSRLKTTFVGHSFGGHILVSAMAQSLVEQATLDRELPARMEAREELQNIQNAIRNEFAARESADGDQVTTHATATLSAYQQKLADEATAARAAAPRDEMVVVVSPAVEGAQFDALSRVNRSVAYDRYRSPRFIAITTIDDDATKRAFPLGRWPSARLKRFPRGDTKGRDAWLKAMGHDSQYLTHELLQWSQIDPTAAPLVEQDLRCDRWASATNSGDKVVEEKARAIKSFETTFNAHAAGAGPRIYCSKPKGDQNVSSDPHLVLHRYPGHDGEGINLNAPVWNVSTRRPILNEHNDFTNSMLVDFVRQLYVESHYVK